MPSDRPKYALGVGNLQAVRDGTLMGYNIFDTVLPTRDARHQRLYLYRQGQFGFLDIGKEKNTRDFRPIEEDCDCHTCQNYPRAYLHHLFEIGDYLAGRLATIHNLRVYTRLIQELRK
jgi:queuine tRNA-ribosyltransferase